MYLFLKSKNYLLKKNLKNMLAIFRQIILFFAGFSVFVFGGKAEQLKNRKVLIVYYSDTDNTKTIAENIQKNLGGDLHRILLTDEYSNDYKTRTEQAKKDLEKGKLPKLKSKLNNLKDYDVVFVGTPVWWGKISTPVMSFLNEYDLSNKTVVPFMTHGGGGEYDVEDDMEDIIEDKWGECNFIEDAWVGYKSTTVGFSKWISNIYKKLSK